MHTVAPEAHPRTKAAKPRKKPPTANRLTSFDAAHENALLRLGMIEYAITTKLGGPNEHLRDGIRLLVGDIVVDLQEMQATKGGAA